MLILSNLLIQKEERKIYFWINVNKIKCSFILHGEGRLMGAAILRSHVQPNITHFISVTPVLLDIFFSLNKLTMADQCIHMSKSDKYSAQHKYKNKIIQK